MNDVNSYLAEVVMGYRKSEISTYEDLDDILFDGPGDKEYYLDGYVIVMEVRHWKPLENVYQARNVLVQLIEKGIVGGGLG